MRLIAFDESFLSISTALTPGSKGESSSPSRRPSPLTSDFNKREALVTRIAQRKRNFAELLEAKKAKKEKRGTQQATAVATELPAGVLISHNGSNNLHFNQKRQSSAAEGAALLQNAVNTIVADIAFQLMAAAKLLRESSCS